MRKRLALLSLAVAVCPATAFASDFYLKLGDVTGDATASDHQGWIEVESYHWVWPRRSTVPTGACGANPGQIRIVKKPDRASAFLWRLSTTGWRIDRGELDEVGPRGEVLSRIDLSNVMVASLPRAHGGQQTEVLTLMYARADCAVAAR